MAASRITPAALVKQLFWASRPVSWINTAYPFAAAFLFVGGNLWSSVFWVGTLFFLIPYNLLMYGINDVFDYESDLRNPRKGSIEGSILDKKWHRPTLLVSFALPIPFVVFLIANGTIASTIWLLIFVFTVIAYSAKGLRFKEIPVLDSFTSATHFFGPMIVGIAIAGGSLTNPSTVDVIFSFMLWGMASHAFGAVQDIKADREGGLASIATAIGAKATVRFALIAYALAGILLLRTPFPGPLAAVAAIPYLAILAPFWNLSDANCEQANKGWRRFIWLNFFAGFVVTMILITSVLTR
jgi:4-hydroxybenzoate polyprenyltransferase